MVAPPLTTTALGSHAPAVAAPASPVSPTVDRVSQLSVLAASLFELRVTYETDLRALTSIQRNLERARLPHASSGEADLLLGEVARLLALMGGTAECIAQQRQTAERHLQALSDARP